MNRLLARIEELRGEIAALARQPAEHAEAHRERERLIEGATEHRQGARRLRERLARLRTLVDAGPVAAALGEVAQELAAGDATLDGLPEDAAAALDRHLAAVDRARAVLGTIDDGLRDARRDREATPADDSILAVAAELGSLLEERHRRHADEARRRDLEAGLHRAVATLAEQRERTGGMPEERLLALDTAIPTIDAVREHEAALDRARSARAEAEARHRALADEVGADDLAAAQDGEPDLEARVAAFAELDALRLERASAQPAAAASLDLTRIVAAAAVAIAGLLAGIALGAAPLGAAAGIGLAAAVLLLAPRRAPQSRDDLERRWAELCDRLGLATDAGPAEVRATGDRLAAERVRRELLADRRTRDEARREELARRERDLERASEAARLAQQAWCSWLRERGLDAGLSPDGARLVLAAADAARRAAAERDRLREQLADLESASAAHAARVDALVVELGLPPAPDAAHRDARLVGLGERLDAARGARRRATELDAQIAQLEGRREPAAREASTADRALAAFLERAGCPDPETLRARAVAAERRRATQRRERELRERLIGLAGGAEAVDDLLREARGIDHARLEVDAAEAADALEAQEAAEREANAGIGAVDATIARLEATAELGDRRQELAQLEGQAAALAQRWAVRAIALRLLETTRARHERERQPDVIRAAEGHFERITAGRYARIVAPPGEASVRVETDGGESRSTDELSRGTSEQLYLALRFGLIEEFATQAEPLPVVMDDILVNFDADRAARAASAIGQLAARHQVLYFTCHPWTAELLDPAGERTVALG